MAIPLGVLLVLFTSSFAVTNHGWVYVIAVATAALVMVASVPLRSTVLLWIGTFWMFAYVTSIVVHYFRGPGRARRDCSHRRVHSPAGHDRRSTPAGNEAAEGWSAGH
jgi:hypothetical protein